MTDRQVREILSSLGGSATPRPGFEEELRERLSVELDEADAEDDHPDAKEILRRIERRIKRPADPRLGFKAELSARLHDDLAAGMVAAGGAPSPRQALPRRLADRLKSGWWLQSAAAVVVLALVASVTTWGNCVSRPPDRQLAAPRPIEEPAVDVPGPPLQGTSDGSEGFGGAATGQTGDEAQTAAPPAAGGVEPAAPPAPQGTASQGKPAPPKPQPPGGASAQPRTMLALSSRTEDGFWHIFTMGEDGTDRTQLTEGPFHDRAPEWSPDGKRIAFTRVEKEENHEGKIFIVSADGSGLRFLTDGGEPSWSPDGTQLVYYTGSPTTLHIINADGSGDRNISTWNGFASADPYWSPRGDRIAFAGAGIVFPPDDPIQHPNKVTQVYTVRPDGSEVRRLTDYTWACNMAFSPDGSRITYTTSSDFLSTNVWTMNADGTDKTQLTNGTGIRAYPHWSPNGKKIAFAWDPDGDLHWSFAKSAVGPGKGAIWIMNADGSDLHRVSPPGFDDADPVYRPTLPGRK